MKTKQMVLSVLLCLTMISIMGMSVWAYQRSVARATLTSDQSSVTSGWCRDNGPSSTYADGIFCNTSNVSKYAIRYYAYGRSGDDMQSYQEAYNTQAIGTSSLVAFPTSLPGYAQQKVIIKGGLSGTKKECIGIGVICER